MSVFIAVTFPLSSASAGKGKYQTGRGKRRRGVIRVGHMCHQIIQQGSFGGIGELAIGIAPLTIILVKGTIRPFAQGGIIQRHAAALADQSARAAQQGVDGDIKQLGQQFQSFGVGHGFAGFPHLKILIMYECLRLLA